MTFQEAQRKARFGHRDWIFFTDKDGSDVCERSSASVIKRAMLATGTSGRFYLLAASTGVPFLMSWRLGVIAIRNAKLMGERA